MDDPDLTAPVVDLCVASRGAFLRRGDSYLGRILGAITDLNHGHYALPPDASGFRMAKVAAAPASLYWRRSVRLRVPTHAGLFG